MNESGDIISLEELCHKVGYKPSRQFEYDALCTAFKTKLIYTLLFRYFLLQDFIYNIGNITPKSIRSCLVNVDIQTPSACFIWQ